MGTSKPLPTLGAAEIASRGVHRSDRCFLRCSVCAVCRAVLESLQQTPLCVHVVSISAGATPAHLHMKSDTWHRQRLLVLLVLPLHFFDPIFHQLRVHVVLRLYRARRIVNTNHLVLIAPLHFRPTCHTPLIKPAPFFFIRPGKHKPQRRRKLHCIPNDHLPPPAVEKLSPEKFRT